MLSAGEREEEDDEEKEKEKEKGTKGEIAKYPEGREFSYAQTRGG